MKPTKEQLVDQKWWDENSKGYDCVFYLERNDEYLFADDNGEGSNFRLIAGGAGWEPLAKRPEPENKKIYWVAKVDCYGTPWNTDGPHESYSKANEGCELLKQVNKKDKYIVTEMTFKKIKTQREELIDLIYMSSEIELDAAAATASIILGKYDLTEKDDN